MSDHQAPAEQDEVLRRWRDALLTTLSAADPALAEAEVDVDAVLALAGDVARGVIRPAAPLTAYLVGLAVGRSGAGAERAAFAAAAARARALAAHGSFASPTPGS